MNVFLANVGNRDIALGIIEEYFLTFSKDQDGADLAEELGCKEGNRNISLYVKEYIDQFDQKKLAIVGFSQGGVMAYSLGLGEPERFAGLAALSSWLPKDLLSVFPDVPATEQLPVLVQHGSQDELVDVGRARQSVEILQNVNVPLTYREYAMGHQLNAESLMDLSNWLQEKVLSPIQLAS